MFRNKQQRQELGRVFRDASAEAQRLGDRRVGTEHMTLALLHDPDSVTAKALGVTLDEAREAVQSLDAAALATIGIQVTEPGPNAATQSRIRLTPGSRHIFSSLRSEKIARPLEPQHILLGLLNLNRPDPAAELLDALHVDRAKVRQQLQAS